MKATRFENIFRAISLPCVVLRPEKAHFFIVDANQAYLSITGSSPEDLLGRNGCEVFPMNPAHENYEGDTLLKSFQKVVLEKQPDRIELLRFDIPIRETGEFLEKYWNYENVPVLDEEGELEYVLHMVKDVTAQVLARKKEQQLQKEVEGNQQQVRHFIEANPEGLYSLDREGKFLHANQGLADIAELPLAELLKMDFLPFCSEDDRDFILEHFHRVIAGEATKFEAKFITARGREIILELSLAPMKSEGKVTGAHGIARDLTLLRQSEKSAVTKKNYLQANAAFINSLFQKELTSESLREPLAKIGEAMDVDRILYFLAQPSSRNRRSVLSLNVEWTNGKVASKKHLPELQDVPKEKLKQLIGDLRRGELYSATLSDLPEGGLKQLCLLLGLKTLLMLPVFLKHRMQGIIVLHDCFRERHWSEEEISFLKTLAANLTTTFEERAAKAALKEQQEALRLSEQKYRALVQEGSDLTAIMDREGNYKFVSDNTTKALGAPTEFYIGRNAFEFIHPEDQDYIAEQFVLLRDFKQFKLAPYRFRNHKGEWRWLETTLTNLVQDPAVQGVVANSSDITKLLAQEREIRQLNERYKLAATATQDLMYDWDMQLHKVTRFHKGGEFLGHSIREVDERDFWGKYIHPEELEGLKEKQEAILRDPSQNHVIAEYRFRRADGTYAHIMDRAYILRDPEGRPIRMVGATRDISSLKANEEALLIANQRFDLAAKATSEMIWDWDLVAGNITWSKVFHGIFGVGVSKDKRGTELWYTKIHPEDRERVEHSVAAAIKDPAVKKWREQYRMIKLNKELAYIEDRAHIVRDASGKAIRMVGSALDTTESRLAVERIRAQNQLLREIAWDQSHLVRAPLARMKMLLGLLDPEVTEAVTQKEILEWLNTSYEELDRIVRGIVRKSEMIKESVIMED